MFRRRLGVDSEPVHCPTPARGRRRGPSVSTTPSSCAISSSSAAVRARRQPRTSVRLTEISSPRGSLAVHGDPTGERRMISTSPRFPATMRQCRGAGSFSGMSSKDSGGRKRKSRASTFTMRLAPPFSTRSASSTSIISRGQNWRSSRRTPPKWPTPSARIAS